MLPSPATFIASYLWERLALLPRIRTLLNVFTLGSVGQLIPLIFSTPKSSCPHVCCGPASLQLLQLWGKKSSHASKLLSFVFTSLKTPQAVNPSEMWLPGRKGGALLVKHKVGKHDPDKTAKCFMDKYNLDARWEPCYVLRMALMDGIEFEKESFLPCWAWWAALASLILACLLPRFCFIPDHCRALERVRVILPSLWAKFKANWVYHW